MTWTNVREKHPIRFKRVYTNDCQRWKKDRGGTNGGPFDLTGLVVMGQVDVSSVWRLRRTNYSGLAEACGNLMRENYTSHLPFFWKL